MSESVKDYEPKEIKFKGEGIEYDHSVKTSCGITLNFNKLPCKGENCKHLLSFDLEPFLKMNYQY